MAGPRDGASEQWTVIAQGSVASKRWAVEAQPDRSGLCLEDLVFAPGEKETALGGGACSRPAATRGSLIVTVDLDSQRRSAILTLVGGAFNKAVARVEMEGFDGRR